MDRQTNLRGDGWIDCRDVCTGRGFYLLRHFSFSADQELPMTAAPSTEKWTLTRAPSGIAGLDTILGGGFMLGGMYIIHGSPGAGKTILTNQICFHYIAIGGRALFITLLPENHARMPPICVVYRSSTRAGFQTSWPMSAPSMPFGMGDWRS